MCNRRASCCGGEGGKWRKKEAHWCLWSRVAIDCLCCSLWAVTVAASVVWQVDKQAACFMYMRCTRHKSATNKQAATDSSSTIATRNSLTKGHSATACTVCTVWTREADKLGHCGPLWTHLIPAHCVCPYYDAHSALSWPNAVDSRRTMAPLATTSLSRTPELPLHTPSTLFSSPSTTSLYLDEAQFYALSATAAAACLFVFLLSNLSQCNEQAAGVASSAGKGGGV